MPNKPGRNPSLAIELFLKGKDDQHLSNVFPDSLDSALFPRPQLRADVIDDWYSALIQLARQPQVEIRKVDEHRRFGPTPFRLPYYFTKAAIDSRNVLDDLDDSDLGDFSGVDQKIATGRPHLFSANPKEFDIGSSCCLGDLTAQSLHQLCTIKFARCLSCGD